LFVRGSGKSGRKIALRTRAGKSALHWKSALENCIGKLHSKSALENCTGKLHWRSALQLAFQMLAHWLIIRANIKPAEPREKLFLRLKESDGNSSS